MTFSALLLAGGKSARMGRDKAFLEIDGEPLWQRQLRVLEQLAPAEVFLSGPRCAEWRERRVLTDAVETAGPLAGLLAGLRASTSDLLVVLAVDLPAMRSAVLRNALKMCVAGRGVMPLVEGSYEPVAAVYPRACLAAAEAWAGAGERKLKPLIARLVADGLLTEWTVPPDQTGCFLNVNTPAELRAFR